LEERETIIYNRNKRESTLEEKRKIYRTGTIIIHTTRTFMPIVAITDTRKQRQKFTSRIWKKRNIENKKPATGILFQIFYT
jgi:hypothetical protein